MNQIFQPIVEHGRTRQAMAKSLSTAVEWDSLSRCYIPVYCQSDRPLQERLGDVIMGGPWGFRGDLSELRESDRHERRRRAILHVLGFYDEEMPDFKAPGYEWRREKARELLLLGDAGGVPDGAGACSPPQSSLPWEVTKVDDSYDARFGVTLTSGKVTTWSSQGTRGNAATNASSVLTQTTNWKGVLNSVDSTQTTNMFLTCAGLASAWRVHYGAWSIVIVGWTTDVATSSVYISNAISTSSLGLGLSMFVNVGNGNRCNAGNGTTNCLSPNAGSGSFANSVPFVWATRYDTSQTAINASCLTRTGVSGLQGTGSSIPNLGSNTDAGVMTLFALTGHGTNLKGSLAAAVFWNNNSAGWQQAITDHYRALGRM